MSESHEKVIMGGGPRGLTTGINLPRSAAYCVMASAKRWATLSFKR